MKRKKVIALLLTASIMATMPAYTLATPMVVHAADLADVSPSEGTEVNNTTENNNQIVDSGATMAENAGTVVTNSGTITTNNGTVSTNNGTVTTNNGAIVSNEASHTVNENNGTGIINDYKNKKAENDAKPTAEKLGMDELFASAEGNGIKDSKGSVTTNNGDILATEDNSTVGTNAANGNIYFNHADVTTNEGYIFSAESDGAVSTNNGTIQINHGTVATNSTSGTIMSNGTSSESTSVVTDNKGSIYKNYGTVTGIGTVELNFGTVNTNSISNVNYNYNKVVVGSGESAERYYGVIGKDFGDSYTNIYMNSLKEDSEFILSLPQGYTNDGKIVCNIEPVREDDDKATKEGDVWIVRVGDKFLISGQTKFTSVWKRIIESQGGKVEVVEEETPSPAPKEESTKMTSASVGGVEINSWNDVSSVLTSMADKIVADPVSNTKTFTLDLSKSTAKTVPTEVITSLSTSNVDALTCTIAKNTAITFTKNETMSNYIPTDFSMTPQETSTMKTLNFYSDQNIGTSVVLTTTVPVAGKPVVIWQLVNGQYVVLDIVTSNPDGTIAFPITTTGNIALTY